MVDTTGESRRWWLIVEIAIVNFIVVYVAYLAYVAKQKRRRRRLPPGPRGWPVVGSLHLLGSLPHRSLEKLSEQYGPVMFLHLGAVPAVVFSNAEMAEAVLKTNDHVTASRPDFIAGRKLFYNRTSPGFTPYGPYWRHVRKICIQGLLSAQRMKQFQAVRQREILGMLHSILETSQKTVIVDEFLCKMTTNNITEMLVGKSYCHAKSESTSTEANLFSNMMREVFDLAGAFNIADFIPIFKPFDLQGYGKRMQVVHEKWDTFLDTVLVEYRQQLLTEKPEKSSETFLDVLLTGTVSDGLNEADKPLPDDNIKAILTDLMSAGADTAAATVVWALAELLKHPSMLKRAQEELDLVVGQHRLVDEADIPELKYIQAVVKETFRLHSPSPLVGPRESMEACEIAGYHIPAKCRIIVNVWRVQRDPLVWERPLEFDPDRFLGTTNIATDVKGNNFQLLPFSSGRRMCPGLNLGLLMVQFPLAQMLHTLNWALPEDQKPEHLDMTESFGLVCRRANPLHVVVQPRLSTDVIYPAYLS